MAAKKGPKMMQELVRRRAQGDGFQTIASDLKLSRNTVKSRLKQAGAYEVRESEALVKSGFGPARPAVYSAHWSSAVAWGEALCQVEGGTPIKEYWEEHLASANDGDLRNVPYETFWREFRRRFPILNVHYHKSHEPGLRTEIDYKGDSHGLGYIDLATGEVIDCRLFGAVLCNSRLFFPLATLNEKQSSWLAGIGESFRYFGGATQLLVVDNTRCAVNAADWFDPDMNQEFYNFCSHHNTTVMAVIVFLQVFWS